MVLVQNHILAHQKPDALHAEMPGVMSDLLRLLGLKKPAEDVWQRQLEQKQLEQKQLEQRGLLQLARISQSRRESESHVLVKTGSEIVPWLPLPSLAELALPQAMKKEKGRTSKPPKGAGAKGSGPMGSDKGPNLTGPSPKSSDKSPSRKGPSSQGSDKSLAHRAAPTSLLAPGDIALPRQVLDLMSLCSSMSADFMS